VNVPPFNSSSPRVFPFIIAFRWSFDLYSSYFFDDIEKDKKKENINSLKNWKKQYEKPKSCGLLHANDMIRYFADSNVINIELKSTKLNKSFLEE